MTRYIERYWLPTLKKNLKRSKWNWNKTRALMEIKNSVCDFRSAENPQNWEGFGYDNIVLNEAGIILSDDYLWENVIKPMMIDNPNTQVIAGGTPKGMNNKFYELAQKALTNKTEYWLKTYTTFDNPFLNENDIKELTEDMPELVYRQEILGEFVEGSGTFVKREYLKYYDLLPENLEIYIAIDPAISEKTSADYTSLCVFGIERLKKEYYIIDIFRKRVSFIESIRNAESYNDKYKPKLVGFEKVAFQTALVQESKRTTNMPCAGIEVHRDKITRFYPVLNKFEVGTIFLNRDLIPEFEKELLSFPLGKHDDMVDSLSLAYSMTDIPEISWSFK
jgi:predicted phage terminase large subunit-like protein